MDIPEIVDIGDIYAARVAAPLHELGADMGCCVGKAALDPMIEVDAVRVVVPSDEFLLDAALDIRPCFLEKRGHDIARHLPDRIVATVLVAPPAIIQMRKVEFVHALAFGQVKDGGQFRVIVHGAGKANAGLEPGRLAKPQSPERSIEGPCLSPECVVGGADAVKADTDVVIFSCFDALDVALIDKRAIRRQPHIEPHRFCARGDVENVGSQKRFAAR